MKLREQVALSWMVYRPMDMGSSVLGALKIYSFGRPSGVSRQDVDFFQEEHRTYGEGLKRHMASK